MRSAFINQLVLEARNNYKIFLIVGDLGYNVIEPFREEFPDRFLNIGVAEQNMAGVASGLATEGYCVYIYSIGNFPTLRCMEQIRYDICYHNLNVKIVSVGAGFSYGPLGTSHHCTEDIGMLRTIPNIVICSPCDPIEAEFITTFSSTYNGPCYIRLGKNGEPTINKKEIISQLQLGHPIQLLKGNNIAVLVTGSILNYVNDFILSNEISASLYSFPFIKPILKQSVLKILEDHQRIIIIEEHQKSCGFSSALLEVINDLFFTHAIDQYPLIKRIGIDDTFINISGTQEYLREKAGLVLSNNDFNF